MARVLVIDDDEGHRTLVRAMLESVGHSVEEAVDGAEGLKLFGQNPPHLVLTDISMPGLDGHEVISALKVVHPDVPIIAISGGGPARKDELLAKANRNYAMEYVRHGMSALTEVVGRERALELARRAARLTGL